MLILGRKEGRAAFWRSEPALVVGTWTLPPWSQVRQVVARYMTSVQKIWKNTDPGQLLLRVRFTV